MAVAFLALGVEEDPRRALMGSVVGDVDLGNWRVLLVILGVFEEDAGSGRLGVSFTGQLGLVYFGELGVRFVGKVKIFEAVEVFGELSGVG